MKIEIELSKQLYENVVIAAKNLKLSNKKFITRAIKKSALANQEKQMSDAECTASLNKFFEENPDINNNWWEDRSWDDCQPSG